MRGPSSPAQAPTILVIEDEAIVREVVQKTLEQNGYRVLVAGGGNEALDLCESSATPIDLVLTDIVMPGTSGADLAGYLASRYSSSQVDHRKVGKLALAIQVAFQELGVFPASGTAVPLQADGSLTRGGARTTLDALERGAFGFIAKPKSKAPLIRRVAHEYAAS